MLKTPPWMTRWPAPAARWGKLFGLSAIVGVSAGVAAAGLDEGLRLGVDHLIGRFTHLGGAQIGQFRWGVLLLPTVGGLLSGLLVHWLAGTEAKSGTNQFIDAFHYRAGHLDLPTPAVKALAAIGVISFGGSAGPEAPTAALGAAIGSKIARLFALTPRERRVLLVAGCGGGIGAVFQCPLGGALFATSVLYREPEFDADSMVPAFVSSVLSYSTFITLMGTGPRLLAGADRLMFDHPLQLIAYAALGPVCAGFSIWFWYCFHLVEGRPLRRLRLPSWFTPALGGLCVGALGCVLPQVMDGQYRFIQHAMSGTLFQSPAGLGHSAWYWVALFGLVAVFKCVATALTVGSGASGGALGPSVFIGGAAGAFLGALIEALFPNVFPPAQMEALRASLIPVGMAGVLAATMGTPMAAVVMVTEMTGSYGLIVPLMLVCVTSYVIGRRWGLNSAQVRTAAESPAHAGDLLVHTLQTLQVRDAMVERWPYCVPPSATLGEMIACMQSGTRPLFAILDRGQLAGVVSLVDISRVVSEPGISSIVIAADIMTPQVRTLHPGQDLYTAMAVFNEAGFDVLPVVDEGGQRFCGMLPRRAIHELIRVRMDELRVHLHREHAGIAAVEQDEQLYQLMLGVSAVQPQSIRRMPVPGEVVGRSIRASNFGREYQAQIIGVISRDGRLQCPADIDAPLHADQVLVVISSPGEDGLSPGRVD